MSAPVEELQRIGIKLFMADGVSVRPREFVPVFHRWIQTQAVSDQMLIDIADYAHVPNGPGVVLVAHQGNFSVDLTGSHMGLAYNRKVPASGALADRLRGVARTTLDACRLLEDEPALGGRIRFRGDELHVFANDRLQAPNTAETLVAFQPALEALLRALYGDAACTVTPEADPQERFGVRVQAPTPASVRELLERTG